MFLKQKQFFFPNILDLDGSYIFHNCVLKFVRICRAHPVEYNHVSDIK